MLLTTRATVIYDLPLSPGTVIPRPEACVIRFLQSKTVDLGSLCYLRKGIPAKRGGKTGGRLIDIDSLNANRVLQIRALVHHISDDLEHSGRRAATVRDAVSRFLPFVAWADENGHSNLFDSAEMARAAAQAYAKHVRERVISNEISINAGARQQATVFGLLGTFIGVDDLTRGINLLRVDSAAKESTVPPDEDDQTRILGLCESLFDGLSDLVVDRKPFPYAVAMPKHLSFPTDRLWIFPSTTWFMSPQTLAHRKHSLRPNWQYNYSEGRVATLAELQDISDYAGNSDNMRRHSIRQARKRIEAANSHSRHTQRLQMGMQALNVFVVLFLAHTGMNWAQTINLTWSDDYEVIPDHQVFRTIKWRAGSKETFFELPVAFMPRFKRFLVLRQYLLGGRACRWLFFKLGPKGEGEPTQLKEGNFAAIYKTLQRLDPDLVPIASRQWRAAKSDWLIRNTDPATTAMVLQNSEATVLASYAAGSEVSHLDEMSDFLNKVANTVLSKGHLIAGEVVRAVGVCSDFGNPHQIAEKAAVLPTCQRPEGCLFCDKFRIHADEDDIRKLVSCRYCLRQTAPLSSSEEQFQVMLAPIFRRISDLLTEISRHDSALVTKVTREVEEDGELDPYWARKFEVLVDLGLVA